MEEQQSSQVVLTLNMKDLMDIRKQGLLDGTPLHRDDSLYSAETALEQVLPPAVQEAIIVL